MDGVLIIDKPAGWTSHDVVARVRRLLGEQRVGHTGTLDPFATGVLVVLLGRATRIARFLAGAEKEYEALIRLGYATDTGDVTGRPRVIAAGIGERKRQGDGATWSDEQIESAIGSLRGEIDQVPPMFSAKKVKGRKLYEMARRGEEIERAPVRVSVREFGVVPRDDATLLRQNDDGTCDLLTRVVCSAGTYVRVLAESVGERLGTGAHLAALRRTRAGAFRIGDALGIESLEEMCKAGTLTKIILSPDAALSNMPFVHLTGDEARRVRHGAPVPVREAVPEWKGGEGVRMHDEQGILVAIGIYLVESGQIHPRVLMVAEEK